jgi:hypothetical protein
LHGYGAVIVLIREHPVPNIEGPVSNQSHKRLQKENPVNIFWVRLLCNLNVTVNNDDSCHVAKNEQDDYVHNEWHLCSKADQAQAD